MVKNKDALGRRLEEVALNAWPALNQLMYDGWILRFAGGYTRRSNSVNLLYPSRIDLLTKIRRCEAVYSQQQLQPVFRMTSAIPSTKTDVLLRERGYKTTDPTWVMFLDLEKFQYGNPKSTCELISRVPEQWLKTHYEIAKLETWKRDIHQRIIKTIIPRKLLAELLHKGQVVSTGLAVLETIYVGLFDIITDEMHRNQGFARELIMRMLQWAQVNGAKGAYLQVLKSNEPAIHLYRSLGFDFLYPYWYRNMED